MTPAHPVQRVGVTVGAATTQAIGLLGGRGGNDTLRITGGTYDIDADTPSGKPNVTVIATGGAAAIAFTGTQHLAGLTLTGGAQASLGSIGAGRTAANHRVLVIAEGGTLSITANSMLDLFDNDLIYNYAVGQSAAALSLVTGLMRTGSNGGGWDGTSGITSNNAMVDGQDQGRFALGVADNGDPDNGPGYGTFAGETLNANARQILVKYTYYGDADLNGRVNNPDLISFQTGLTMQGNNGWLTGNFDFSSNGVISNNDLLLFQTGLLASAVGPQL